MDILNDITNKYYSAVLRCMGAAVQSATNGIRNASSWTTAVRCLHWTYFIRCFHPPIGNCTSQVSRMYCFIPAIRLIQYSIQYGCSFFQSEASFRLPWAIPAVPGPWTHGDT
ncbi:hypothetical protein V1515DRAFT_261624 [Lipomyces mesembrius]